MRDQHEQRHRAPPQKEVMLQQAGFKTHMVTTARQKRTFAGATEGKVSM